MYATGLLCMQQEDNMEGGKRLRTVCAKCNKALMDCAFHNVSFASNMST
jgi:hypothetical protein